MQDHNKLKEILTEGLQIDNFKPSPNLLDDMHVDSLKRFTNILNNVGTDLTAREKEGIEKWLYQVTGLKFDIFKDGSDRLEIRNISAA